jgi:hypothetical protein
MPNRQVSPRKPIREEQHREKQREEEQHIVITYPEQHAVPPHILAIMGAAPEHAAEQRSGTNSQKKQWATFLVLWLLTWQFARSNALTTEREAGGKKLAESDGLFLLETTLIQSVSAPLALEINQNSLLQIAAKSKAVALLKILQNAPTKVNKIRSLLDQGAEINMQDAVGHTPLHYGECSKNS